MQSKRQQIRKYVAINRRVPASVESQLKTSLQFSLFAPYLPRVNLCKCAMFCAVILTHFSNKTSIIMPHQVRDLHANFQAFQTSSFEIEVYQKGYLRFFSISSAAEWCESKKLLYSPPKQSLEQRGPIKFFRIDAEFPLFERRDSGF